jgi:hypothetical protein
MNISKRLPIEEIVRQAAIKQGMNPIVLHNALSHLVHTDPNFRIMRANNTLFGYYNVGDGNVEILMETLDSPRALIDSIQEFCKAMRIAGFKEGRFQVDNPQILKAIEIAGYKYHVLPRARQSDQPAASVEF